MGGGALTLSGLSATLTSTGGEDLTLTTTRDTSVSAGDVELTSTDTVAGAVSLIAGDGTSNADGGDVVITAGSAASGTPGKIKLGEGVEGFYGLLTFTLDSSDLAWSSNTIAGGNTGTATFTAKDTAGSDVRIPGYTLCSTKDIILPTAAFPHNGGSSHSFRLSARLTSTTNCQITLTVTNLGTSQLTQHEETGGNYIMLMVIPR